MTGTGSAMSPWADMPLRYAAAVERVRNSLFFVPMVFVVAAVALALLGLRLDEELLENGSDLPFGLTSTVDSARSVLSTVASATITVAGIAFSVSLLIIQLASSQYSPRVVPGLFRDPFNKRVMGVVVGTFTYCLVVLRSVRSPLGSGGEPVIPNLSVALATVFGVLSILAIVAFISHNAHAMDVSRILHDVTEDAVDQVRRQWSSPDEEEGVDAPGASEPPDGALVVTFDHHGWVQNLDIAALAGAADAGATVRLDTSVGRYAVMGTPLCTIWPAPGDPDAARRRARGSVVIGESRTSPQDVSYGVRQLADVALKALSPGINDPTTAQDALFHMGTVLRELLVRRPPPVRQAVDDRTVILAERPTHEDLVALAFDEVRLAAAELPAVAIYLLEVLHLLELSLDGDDLRLAAGPLRHQAALIRDAAERSETLLPADARRVVQACEARFGPLSPVR